MPAISPTSSLTMIQKDLAKLAKERRIDLYQAYIKGERFRRLFALLPGELIEACLTGVARTRASCRLPAKPKPIGTVRLAWDAVRKAKLKAMYDRFGPKAHVAVAAEMGLTVGQVRLASRRFLIEAPQAAFAKAA